MGELLDRAEANADRYRQALRDIAGIIECESATLQEAQEHPLWRIAAGALDDEEKAA